MGTASAPVITVSNFEKSIESTIGVFFMALNAAGTPNIVVIPRLGVSIAFKVFSGSKLRIITKVAPAKSIGKHRARHPIWNMGILANATLS